MASEDTRELSDSEVINMVKGFETLLKTDSLSTKSEGKGTYIIKNKFYLSIEADDVRTKVHPATDGESLLVYEIDVDDRISSLVSADSRFPHVITYTNKEKKQDSDDRCPAETLTRIAQYSALSKLRNRLISKTVCVWWLKIK